MKQTAVEWLSEKLLRLTTREGISISWVMMNDLLEQAEDIEKQRIIEAYQDGVKETNSRCEYQNAENYYNETFNK